MIADIVIEPTTGEFDIAALESYLESLPLIARDPKVPHQFLHASPREFLDEAVAKRAADGKPVSYSVMLFVVAAQRVNIVYQSQDVETARHFIHWIRRRYPVHFRDNDYGEDVPEVDDDLAVLFGPVQQPHVGNYDEHGFFVLNDPLGLVRELLDALITKNNPWIDQLIKHTVTELTFAGLRATYADGTWQFTHPGREGEQRLTPQAIDEMTDVAWQLVHNYRNANFPRGATLDQGRYELQDELFGDADRGLYRAENRATGKTVLVSLGARQSVSMETLRGRFAYEQPGIAPVQYIGALDASDAAPHHALVEAEPSGAPTSFLIDRIDDLAVARLGLAVAEIVAAAHAGGRVLVGMRPELIYIDGARVTGIAPRCEPFHMTMVRPDHGGAPCFSHCYLAPEVLAFPDQLAAPAADVFSLAAMIAKWHTGDHPFAGEYGANMIAISAGQRTPWRGHARVGALLDTGLAPVSSRATLDQLVTGLRALCGQS